MAGFPKDFFWGAATSAYQVEGNNINSDWWAWEKSGALKEFSGEACRHYEQYLQDFDLAKSLCHNAHRLSIEWSRIEPQEAKFQEKEIAHYIDVISALKERGLEPIVTLHHFTNPIWFSQKGGWLGRKSAFYFCRYVAHIVEALCGKVKYWVTINEPMVYVYNCYILGIWPPQEKSFLKARAVVNSFIIAHVRSYRQIHNIYKQKNLASPCISIAKNLQGFVCCRPTLKNRIATYIRQKFFNFEFIERLIRYRAIDFIGVNYYSRSLVDVSGWGLRHMALEVCSANHRPLKKNSLGWDIYPEGLYDLLLKLKGYNLPVFILENGICTQDDSARWDFIYGHLKYIHSAIGQGVKILGYIYWSLIDNFEWDKGFGPCFGLVEIDYRNFNRSVRESAKKFALVCQTKRV